MPEEHHLILDLHQDFYLKQYNIITKFVYLHTLI